MSDPGECGIWSDWEMSIRMWVAGWQVAYMPLVQKQSDKVGGPRPSATSQPCISPRTSRMRGSPCAGGLLGFSCC